ncbi:MAG: SRPBCC family protein [Saprospiraceae bacterium]
MSIHSLKSVQRLPISAESAWDFFSNPMNLKEITPEKMGLHVTSDPDFSTRKMYAGQVITYTVKPIWGIPLFWMTEITHVQEGQFFVDEQRVGPYALWHHQHHFKAIPGGVEMTDLIHYRVPLGWLGDVANWLFVRRQLEGIFVFRKKKLEAVFGGMEGDGPRI